jgi:ketosteroid isomerase-like protein
MRICPTCRTQYTDDTLRYCLQDGAALVEQLQSDTPTVAFKKEHETVEASAKTSSRSGVTTSSDEELTRVAAAKKTAGVRPDFDGACRRPWVWLLLSFSQGALGIWLYLKDGGTVPTSSNNANVNVNGSLSGNSGTNPPTPIPFPSNTPTPVPLPTPTPQVNSEEARKEVSQTIYGWKSMAESKNLDAYMGNYADTVDYYNHSGASRSYVRSDKARAFEMYDSISVDLSNMNVSVDESGNKATATFDKEWDFQGSRNSSGKVQTQLKLRNVNGRWLIVGERDLRVYYTR